MSLCKTEFPDYDGNLYIPKGFEDASYHNDVCPRVQKTIIIPGFGNVSDTEVTFILWQNYVDPQKREYEEEKRYVFEIQVNGANIFYYDSDDLDVMKTFISNCIQ